MRAKLTFAIGLGVLSLTIMVALKLSSLSLETRSDFLQSSMRSEVGLVKSSTQFLTRQYANQLTQQISTEEALRQNNLAGEVNVAFINGAFLAMGLLEPTASGSGWKVRWSKAKNGVSSGWAKNPSEKDLADLPLAAMSESNILWSRSLSETGHALYTLLIQVQFQKSQNQNPFVAFAVLDNQAFAQVVESFKTTTREAMVLDDRGHALGYTSQQYVGAPMTSHPMVEALLNERKVMEVGDYKDRSGEAIVAAYERLDESNLYVAVAQKVGGFPHLFSAQLLSLLGFAVAAFLLAMAIGFVLLRPTLAAYEYLQDLAIALAQGLPVRQPAHFADMPPVLIQSVQKLQTEPLPVPASQEVNVNAQAEPSAPALKDEEKVSIYKEVAAGLALAIREPVNVILGQSQLARTRSEEGALKDHYTAIEREARRVRGTIENLMKVSGEDQGNMQRVDLHEVVLSVLKELKGEIESYGVHVKKDLRPSGQILADPKKLKTAVAEIIKNAAESMIDSLNKELFLIIKDEGNELVFMVQDSGPGIEDTILSKVFTPFFTTKGEMDHKGLGLSMAKGIVESNKGRINVESTGEQGTRLKLVFPLTQSRSVEVVNRTVATPDQEKKQDIKTGSAVESSLPPIESSTLAGKTALTGSDDVNFPSTPSLEEEVEIATLEMNKGFDQLKSYDSDLDLISGEDDEEEAKAVATDRVSQSIDDEFGFAVKIRKPKVGSSE